MSKLLKLALAGLASTVAIPAYADTQLVHIDGDSPSYVAPGVSGSSNDITTDEAATVGAWNAAGWSGMYSAYRYTGNPGPVAYLTLGGLAPNSSVRIGSGVLGFLESWDSTNGAGGASPDYLDVFINNVLIASLTSNNASGTIKNYAGATELFSGVQANTNYSYSDNLIDLSTASFANSFADGSGNWTFGLRTSGAGWQGGSDEGWGLDNLSIYGTLARVPSGVPEPGTWAMMLVGFGFVGGAMRAKTRRENLTVSYA